MKKAAFVTAFSISFFEPSFFQEGTAKNKRASENPLYDAPGGNTGEGVDIAETALSDNAYAYAVSAVFHRNLS